MGSVVISGDNTSMEFRGTLTWNIDECVTTVFKENQVIDELINSNVILVNGREMHIQGYSTRAGEEVFLLFVND